MSGASSQRSDELAPGASAGRAAIPHQDPLTATIVRIAAIWIVSDAGYYFVLPRLGVHPSYNAASVGIALYYFFWIGIAIIAFWDLYRDWVKFGNRTAISASRKYPSIAPRCSAFRTSCWRSAAFRSDTS